jgi:hypothetical protein
LYVHSITTIIRLIDSRLWRTHVEAKVEAVIAVLAIDHGDRVDAPSTCGGNSGDEERESEREEERELHDVRCGIGFVSKGC